MPRQEAMEAVCIKLELHLNQQGQPFPASLPTELAVHAVSNTRNQRLLCDEQHNHGIYKSSHAGKNVHQQVLKNHNSSLGYPSDIQYPRCRFSFGNSSCSTEYFHPHSNCVNPNIRELSPTPHRSSRDTPISIPSLSCTRSSAHPLRIFRRILPRLRSLCNRDENPSSISR